MTKEELIELAKALNPHVEGDFVIQKNVENEYVGTAKDSIVVHQHYDKGEGEEMRGEGTPDTPNAPNAKTPPICPYINMAHDYYRPEQIDRMIRDESKKSARAFGNWLSKKAVQYKYIDFGKDNGREIYDTLKRCYGLTYSYQNFMDNVSL